MLAQFVIMSLMMYEERCTNNTKNWKILTKDLHISGCPNSHFRCMDKHLEDLISEKVLAEIKIIFKKKV
jgi:hypothetical protein